MSHAALRRARACAVAAACLVTNIYSGVGAGTSILYANNSNTLLQVYSNTQVYAYNGTQTLVATLGNSGTINSSFRAASQWSPSGRSVVANGGAVASDANSRGSTVSAAYLGSSNGASFADGHITKLAIYNLALTASQLQARTVLGSRF